MAKVRREGIATSGLEYLWSLSLMPQVPQPIGSLYLRGPYQVRPGKYNPEQICSLLEASSYASPRSAWACLILIFQEIPSASPGSLLYFSQPESTHRCHH